MISTDDKLGVIAGRQLRRHRKSVVDLDAHIAIAKNEANILVGILLAIDPEIHRIVLFGSLARGDVTSPDFDIDLAVDCTEGKYLALVAATFDRARTVDVVDMRKMDKRIRDAVERDGLVLYEK